MTLDRFINVALWSFSMTVMGFCVFAWLLFSGCAGDGADALPPEVAATPKDSQGGELPAVKHPPEVKPPKDDKSGCLTTDCLPPAEAPKAKEVLTVAVTANFGADTAITGTFTYVIAQGPIGTNVRSLVPNVIYQMEDWAFTVKGGQFEENYPSTVYSKADMGNSVEFCVGNCLFGSPQLMQLTFTNATTNRLLTLVFSLNDPTPFINPPSTQEELGTFVGSGSSMYRAPCPPCVPLAILSGEIVPIEKG